MSPNYAACRRMPLPMMPWPALGQAPASGRRAYYHCLPWPRPPRPPRPPGPRRWPAREGGNAGARQSPFGLDVKTIDGCFGLDFKTIRIGLDRLLLFSSLSSQGYRLRHTAHTQTRQRGQGCFLVHLGPRDKSNYKFRSTSLGFTTRNPNLHRTRH
eukprot:7473941-Heterocapsa_arctica.AAC.1